MYENDAKQVEISQPFQVDSYEQMQLPDESATRVKMKCYSRTFIRKFLAALSMTTSTCEFTLK